MNKEQLQRFHKKYVVDQETGCWMWTDSLASGYGRMSIRRKLVGAHRLAYSHWVGTIPKGWYVHHRCGNKACVNPEHLETVQPLDHKVRHLGPPEDRR